MVPAGLGGAVGGHSEGFLGSEHVAILGGRGPLQSNAGLPVSS